MAESRFVSRVTLVCSVIIVGASVRALADDVTAIAIVFLVIGIAVAAGGWVVDKRASAVAGRRDAGAESR